MIAALSARAAGLNPFSASLPWREGDNVVLCPELEPPNNTYLWYNLERLRGIEVRAIPPEDGRMPVGAMGLFTGQPRSADIIAHDNSTAIVLNGKVLKVLLSGAIDMHLKVLYNVISTLSQRVADANGLTETQARLIRDLEKKLEDDDEDDDEYDEDEIYVEQA